MNEATLATVRQFCVIQLEILKDKESKLQKDLLDLKIQREFLEGTLVKIEDEK
jgi:hypothetical protein